MHASVRTHQRDRDIHMPIYIFSKSKFLFTNLISLNEKYLSSALTVSGNTLETCLGVHNNQSKKALGSYRAIEDLHFLLGNQVIGNKHFSSFAQSKC